jgi:hypothetical protein
MPRQIGTERGKRKEFRVKIQFPSPTIILPEVEGCVQTERIQQSFGNSPNFEFYADGKQSLLDLVKAKFPHVETKRRGQHIYIVGINDVRQNERAGWVVYLNNQIPPVSPNQCFPRTGDRILLLFVPMPIGFEWKAAA